MQATPKDYGMLFCVEDLTPMERMMAPAENPYAEKIGGMHHCAKTIVAGDTIEVDCYPILGRSGERAAEKIKRGMSREKQQRYNRKQAERKLALLLDANFTEKDLHVTLTYREETTLEQAKHDMELYVAKMKRLRKKKGLDEPKYVYVIEEEDGQGMKKRLHIHLVLNAGLTREEIETKWGKGWANCDRLQPEQGTGLEALAKYLHKSVRGDRAKGRRAWCASKNLKKPKTTVNRTKMTNRRVRQLCSSLPGDAEQVIAKLYPGYKLGWLKVYTSEWIAGVYVRMKLRKIG